MEEELIDVDLVSSRTREEIEVDWLPRGCNYLEWMNFFSDPFKKIQVVLIFKFG